MDAKIVCWVYKLVSYTSYIYININTYIRDSILYALRIHLLKFYALLDGSRQRDLKMYRNKHIYKVLAIYKIIDKVPGVAREKH